MRTDSFAYRMGVSWGEFKTWVGLSAGSTLVFAVSAGLIVAYAVFSSEFLLLVLGCVQLLAVMTMGEREADPDARRAVLSTVQSVGRGVVRGVVTLALIQYRLALRLLTCLLASLSTGLLTLGAFALTNTEDWRLKTLTAEGPPLGPAAVIVGAMLITLLLSGWIVSRKPLVGG